MNSLNSILIEGNLVQDPESTTTPTGTLICDFTIATDRFYKQDKKLEKEVSYFDIEAWAQLAKTCLKNLKKGQCVRIVGRLKQDHWTGFDGDIHSKVKIVAEHVELKPVRETLKEEEI